MRRIGKSAIGSHAANLVFFAMVVFHFFVHTISEATAGETLLVTYECQWPDPRLGSGLVLKVFTNARATLTFKGVVIADEQDQESDYSYSEDGTTLKLSPRSDSARQIGAIRYARSNDTLTFNGVNGSLNCSKR